MNYAVRSAVGAEPQAKVEKVAKTNRALWLSCGLVLSPLVST